MDALEASPVLDWVNATAASAPVLNHLPHKYLDRFIHFNLQNNWSFKNKYKNPNEGVWSFIIRMLELGIQGLSIALLRFCPRLMSSLPASIDVAPGVGYLPAVAQGGP